MDKVSTTRLLAIALLAPLAVLSGCADDAAERPASIASVAESAARDAVFDSIRSRQEVISTTSVSQSALETLPNVSWSIDEAAPVPFTTGAFIGLVVDVQFGQATSYSGNGREVLESFDDAADTRTYLLTLEVAETLATESLAPGDQITLGVVLGGEVDPDEAVQGLESLDDVFVEFEPSSVFEDQGIPGVSNNGAFLMPVDGQSITHPGFDEAGMGPGYFEGFTLDAVREYVQTPRVIEVGPPPDYDRR